MWARGNFPPPAFPIAKIGVQQVTSVPQRVAVTATGRFSFGQNPGATAAGPAETAGYLSATGHCRQRTGRPRCSANRPEASDGPVSCSGGHCQVLDGSDPGRLDPPAKLARRQNPTIQTPAIRTPALTTRMPALTTPVSRWRLAAWNSVCFGYSGLYPTGVRRAATRGDRPTTSVGRFSFERGPGRIVSDPVGIAGDPSSTERCCPRPSRP